ncbi:MAG: hypothetical protein IJ515_04100 [Clostridia bacterium]|nr:hypothetical protein [Clostridia bacterium]
MKKRLICLVLALTLLVGAVAVLASCGGGDDDVVTDPCANGHTDADNNGKCDVCKTVLQEDHDCIDEDGDEYCDICGDEYYAPVEIIDYPWDSETLIFQFTENDNNKELPSGCHRYLAGDDDQYNFTIDKNVRRRNADAEKATSIKIRYAEYWPNTDNYGWSSVIEKIEDIVNSKGVKDTPDVYCNFVYDLAGCAVKGYFANLRGTSRGTGELEGQNYFLFMEPDYNESVDNGGYMNAWMNSVTLSKHKTYLLGSDYFTDMIRAFFIMPVSVSVLNKVGPKVTGDYDENGTFNIDDFYAQVKDMYWTYDLLIEYSKAAHIDDGKSETALTWLGDKQVGFAVSSGGLATCGLIFTQELDIIRSKYNEQKKDNDYFYPTSNDALEAYSSAVKKLVTAEGVAYVEKVTDANDPYNIDKYGGTKDFHAIRNRFSEGAVLFGDIMMVGALEYEEYQKMADDGGFGVVPVPLYAEDAAETYLTQIHNVARPGAIAKNTTKFVQCTAFLNYQSTHSTDILNDYYNTELMVRIAGGAKGTVEMLQYVRDHVRDSFDQAMEDAMAVFIGKSAQERKITYMFSTVNFEVEDIRAVYTAALPSKYKAIEDDPNQLTDLQQLLKFFTEAKD